MSWRVGARRIGTVVSRSLRPFQTSASVGRSAMSGYIEDFALRTALKNVKLEGPSSRSGASIDTPIWGARDPISEADLASPASPASVVDVSAFEGGSTIDPFAMVSEEMRAVSTNIRELLGVDHPVLSTVAKYFFNHDGGKKFRPAMVMLMSHAVNASGSGGEEREESGTSGMNLAESSGSYVPQDLEQVLLSQQRLAEISEMIHTASLLHDDVIDVADTRRGLSSVNSLFGNKLAILAGDFLLARASICLARLRNVPVIELMSTIIEHLVKGEVMQMRTALRQDSEHAADAAFDMYMRKTFYKTGSLMANSCQSSVLLGFYPEYLADAAWHYGKHIGLAFQLVDDVLDFESSGAVLGKPALNDLKNGIATAPVLFASQSCPDMLRLWERKFEAPGDIDSALAEIHRSDGLQRTRALAVSHAQRAVDALKPLAPSPYRSALAALACRVVDRVA